MQSKLDNIREFLVKELSFENSLLTAREILAWNDFYRGHNFVFVKTDGNSIHVVCHKEEQTDPVVRKMTADRCILTAYEEWDKDEDKKWILTFIIDDEHAAKHEMN